MGPLHEFTTPCYVSTFCVLTNNDIINIILSNHSVISLLCPFNGHFDHASVMLGVAF